MLIRLILTMLARMARRVLDRPWKVVNHTVLYALTIYGVGCVIPTPLDRQPTPTNYAPSIDTMLTTPTLGPINRTLENRFSWHVEATDPNVNDTLYAQIAERIGDGVYENWFVISLNKQTILDERQPAHFTGDSTPNTWCNTFGGAGVHYIYLFVADQPFSTNLDMSNPFVTAGMLDSNHWELTCS
jgi:hypothetical protein